MRRLARPLLAVMALGLLLGACSGTNGQAWSGDNCTTEIAALYTEQCNPYLSRPGPD
jgi:hypothetical protein